MTAVLQTTAHMETRAFWWNLAWAPWEAACCSLYFCFSLKLPLLLTLSPLNQTPAHSITALRGKQGLSPIHRGRMGSTGMSEPDSLINVDEDETLPVPSQFVFSKLLIGSSPLHTLY